MTLREALQAVAVHIKAQETGLSRLRPIRPKGQTFAVQTYRSDKAYQGRPVYHKVGGCSVRVSIRGMSERTRPPGPAGHEFPDSVVVGRTDAGDRIQAGRVRYAKIQARLRRGK